MLPPGEYIPLESAIASLRRESPEVLKAIAKTINSVEPHAEFNRETIAGSRYGNSIPGFAITYGQLGAYLNTAVTRLVSVLIETKVGVIESSHVAVNREWLFNQREHAACQPEVMREIELRSYASHGATVTPIIQPLEDQDPKAARAELRKLNIRIERNLVIRPDDERDGEIERLLELLEVSNAEKIAATAEKTALAKMVRTLTIENDRLRISRANSAHPVASVQPTAPKAKKLKITNVEILNEEVRATRKAIAERARLMWSHEDYSKHKTMDMVRTIRCLAETEPMGRLPATDEVLARWLSEDAAPPFAKRPGRPRKEKSKK
ncbi:hypothetical protein KDX30_20135 [Pseudomonas sp. CDFA 553]|uniref:hypothetical protein n=1 Tax=Pseudomonas quasicaspiana TaxID=2829821 RepID=UPI001E385FDB|nr:hypothetical protein [Pseudomonas quasicaspiana]MCD5990201.1 hypothetical protein [Pseudomonas quasicaspiana]